MYTSRHIENITCNYCGSGKAVSITQPQCVYLDLGIQHAMYMSRIVAFGLRGATIFFLIIS
jgi:hypothetical protein